MPALNKETFLKKVIKRKRTSYGFQPFFLLARVRCYKRWDRKVFPEGQQEEKEEEMEGMKAGRSAGQLLGILLPQLSNNDVHNVFERVQRCRVGVQQLRPQLLLSTESTVAVQLQPQLLAMARRDLTGLPSSGQLSLLSPSWTQLELLGEPWT